MNSPHRLFKYLPPARISFLSQPMVRFTPPDEFNDPFDLLPNTSKYARGIARKFWRDSVRHGFANDQHPFKTRQEYEAALLRYIGEGGMTLNEHLEDAHAFFMRGLQKSFGKQFGVLSMACEPFNLLMWAHYCRNHTGLVVEFNAHHEFFLRLEGDYVRYSLRRPVVRNGMGDGDESSGVLLTKGREWSYEKEFRFFAPAHPARNYLTPVPIEAVRAVYLGCRMRTQDVNTVRRALQLPGRHHIAAHRMARNLTRFSLDLIPFR